MPVHCQIMALTGKSHEWLHTVRRCSCYIVPKKNLATTSSWSLFARFNNSGSADPCHNEGACLIVKKNLQSLSRNRALSLPETPLRIPRDPFKNLSKGIRLFRPWQEQFRQLHRRQRLPQPLKFLRFYEVVHRVGNCVLQVKDVISVWRGSNLHPV